MALVLLRDENEGRDKHVESTLFPRLDEGSIPSSSTKKVITNVITFFVAMRFYQRTSRGTQKGASITKVMRNHHNSMPIFICGAIHSLYQRATNYILLASFLYSLSLCLYFLYHFSMLFIFINGTFV